MLVLTTALACLCAGPVPPSQPNKGRSHHAAAAHDRLDSAGCDQDRLCGVRRASWHRRASQSRRSPAPHAGPSRSRSRGRRRSIRRAGWCSCRWPCTTPRSCNCIRLPRCWRVPVVSRSRRYAVGRRLAVRGRPTASRAIPCGWARPDARWVFDHSLGAPPAPPAWRRMVRPSWPRADVGSANDRCDGSARGHERSGSRCTAPARTSLPFRPRRPTRSRSRSSEDSRGRTTS